LGVSLSRGAPATAVDQTRGDVSNQATSSTVQASPTSESEVDPPWRGQPQRRNTAWIAGRQTWNANVRHSLGVAFGRGLIMSHGFGSKVGKHSADLLERFGS